MSKQIILPEILLNLATILIAAIYFGITTLPIANNDFAKRSDDKSDDTRKFKMITHSTKTLPGLNNENKLATQLQKKNEDMSVSKKRIRVLATEGSSKIEKEEAKTEQHNLAMPSEDREFIERAPD